MELKTDRLEESLSWWSKLLLNLCLQDERMIARAVKKQTVKRFQEPSTSLQLSTGQEEERKVLRVLPSSPWVPRNQGWLNFWETKIMTERVWGCGHRKEAFCRRISRINHVTPSRRMREGSTPAVTCFHCRVPLFSLSSLRLPSGWLIVHLLESLVHQ